MIMILAGAVWKEGSIQHRLCSNLISTHTSITRNAQFLRFVMCEERPTDKSSEIGQNMGMFFNYISHLPRVLYLIATDLTIGNFNFFLCLKFCFL